MVKLGDIEGLASKISYVKNNYAEIKEEIFQLKKMIASEYSLEKHVKLLEEHIECL